MARTADPEQVASLYAEGLKLKQIATRLDVSYHQVRKAAQEAGLAMRGRGNAVPRERIVEVYLASRSAVEAAGKLGVHVDTVKKNVRAAGVQRRRGRPRTYEINEAFFDHYTREACYWAGFTAADGSLVLSQKAHRLQFMLQPGDREHLEAFKRCAGSTHPVKDVVADGVPEVNLIISCRRWWDALHERFNITQRKSFTLQPPPPLMPTKMDPHFARGYFDGDGGFQANGKQLGVYSGSRRFLQYLAAYSFWGGKIKPHQSIWRLTISGKNMRDALKKLYRNSTEDTRLVRKYEQMKEVMGG